MDAQTRIFGRISATKILTADEIENVAGGPFMLPNTVGDSYCQECGAITSAGGVDCRTVADDCAAD